MKSSCYGFPGAWNANVTHRLGLLLCSLTPIEMESLTLEAMGGIANYTIDEMPLELLEDFSESQASNKLI